MAKETGRRRDDLRERLTALAESEIRENGMKSLRARALAKDANCSVGAIYTVFDDLTGLVMAVNGRTFQRLGRHVSGAVVKVDGQNPKGALIAMAIAYFEFAKANPRLWRALFDIDMSVDNDVPDWYLGELGRLFALIAEPLGRLYPNACNTDIDLRTRALFSSVHGIVLLGTERRISGVPDAQIDKMIKYLLLNVTS